MAAVKHNLIKVLAMRAMEFFIIASLLISFVNVAQGKVSFGKPVARPPIAKSPANDVSRDESDEPTNMMLAPEDDENDDGDPDGAMDDEENELVTKGSLKPEDAQKLPETDTGRFILKTPQPIFADGNSSAKVVGQASPSETLFIVTPGAKFHRVRFPDGRTGYIRSSEVVGERKKSAMETECSTCNKSPEPADSPRPTSDLSKIITQIGIQTKPAQPVPRTPLKKTAADEVIATGVALSQGRLDKLVAAANHQARVCRAPAKYLQRRKNKRTGRRYGSRAICGNHSKGLCFAAVKDALVEAGITKRRLPYEAAKSAHYKGALKNAGMRDIMASLRNKYGKRNLQTIATKAPVGSVLVYDGGSHGYGHIEIKTGGQRYCSDYCKNQPANKYLTRRLIGVYVP